MRRAPALAAGVLVAGAVAVAGCSASPEQPEGGTPTTLPPLSAPQDASAPAAAPLSWAACGADGLECSTLTVPVDWAAPDGPTVDLALARVRATGGAADGDGDGPGVLVVDPGGPGASGVDWLRTRGTAIVTDDVAERLDVVAFDPRGAGASDPVVCLDDAQMDAHLAGEDGDGDGATLMARGCAERGGPLLAHMDVASVARDLEALRAALRQEQLHYLGKSWGTLLGATYADLHPERVGRMVLDGALDPARDSDEVLLGQAGGLEASLGAYLADCADRRSCPLDPDPAAGGAQVAAVLTAADRSPLPTGTERELTGPLALTGVIAPLYDDDTWPLLDDALAAARGGDGAALLDLADSYAGRRPDGTYTSNLLQAFTAYTCLDSPSDPTTGPDATPEALAAAAPVLGPFLTSDVQACEGWPVPPVRDPAALRARGAAPILVVGTTGDPATPYAWAGALADELDTGRLLTWEGEGHTAYRQGSACVDAAVDAYLLDGVLPGEGATCRTS